MAKPIVTVDNPENGPRMLIHREGIAFADGKHSHFQTVKVVLNTGANIVAREEWDLVFQHESNKRSCEEWGITYRLSGPSVMNPREALAAIERTSDVEMLQAWAKNESRPKVAKAIEDQIAAIRKGVSAKAS